jgi:hypothetical protein
MYVSILAVAVAPLPLPPLKLTVGTPVNAVPLFVTAIPFTSPSELIVAVAAAELPPPPLKATVGADV